MNRCVENEKIWISDALRSDNSEGLAASGLMWVTSERRWIQKVKHEDMRPLQWVICTCEMSSRNVSFARRVRVGVGGGGS